MLEITDLGTTPSGITEQRVAADTQQEQDAYIGRWVRLAAREYGAALVRRTIDPDGTERFSLRVPDGMGERG